VIIEVGQVWSSGQRSVEVIARDPGRVVVRDTYGWRRDLSELELERGFVPAGRDQPNAHVMARRALPDIEPA
jgi:hypothetical protein